MVTLLDLFSENDQVKKWHQSLTDKKRQLILGLSTSTKALAIASSLEKEDKGCIIDVNLWRSRRTG